MSIHLNHNGKELGQFSREQVEGMIRSGIISYDTLAWAEGHTTWKPLHEIIGTPVPPLIQSSNVVPSTAMHPVAAYFVPIGRVGRGSWLLRNLANGFGGILLAAPFVDSHSDGAVVWICLLAVMWIYLGIVNAGKRLHDLNCSAWFSPIVFFPLVPLFLLFLRGTNGPNKYGPQPGNKFLR